MNNDKSFTYAGQTYFYDDDTRFYLETGRYDNEYKIRMIRSGEPDEIINDYELYQISNGYKKRFSMMRHSVKVTIDKRTTWVRSKDAENKRIRKTVHAMQQVDQSIRGSSADR